MNNLLKGVADSDLRSEEVCFNAGDIICGQGEPSTWIMVVLDGSCEVRKDDELIATLIASGMDYRIVGEVGLILQEPRTATVIASTEVKAVKLYADDVDELIREAPDLCNLMMRSLARNLQKTTEDLINAKLIQKSGMRGF